MKLNSQISIAILPFVNYSVDKDKEYFSDGITEEIINALAQIEQLKVTSRRSSFYFKGKNVPLKNIAEQLDVEIILEGSVKIMNDQVRISAQLIQAIDDYHFWSERWDRRLDNLFEIEDEIALIIAEKLREQLGHFEINEHLIEAPTKSLDAYEYALKAKYLFNKWNPTDVHEAIELLEQAIAIDPDYADAYIGLADAYSFLGTTEFLPREQAWMKTVEYTNKAYALNKNNAGVHYLLANLSFFSEFNFAEAHAHTEKSILLKPNYPEGLQYMSFLHLLTGNINEAKKYLDLALGVDPFNDETLFYKAFYLYRTNEIEKAESILNGLLDRNSKNIPATIMSLYCLIIKEKFDEALSMMENLPEDIVIPDEELGIKTLIYILKGDKTNKDLYYQKLIKQAENPYSFQAHAYLFLSYVNMGQIEKAFSYLDEVISMKSSLILLWFSDPLANGINQDSRYPKYHQLLYQMPIEKKHSSTSKAPLLDENTASVYKEKLLHFLDSELAFLNPTLSLNTLAQQIEIHPNQLSWVINNKLNAKFNEFINSYRVEHFKILAKDPQNAHISILGLAYESGFNSKTVFNTFFKKKTGMTPNQFIKGIL